MRDSGLAPERTALSWQRTALALAANGGLLLVRSPLGGPAGVVVAAAAFALAGWVGWLAVRRAGELEREPFGAAVGRGVVLWTGTAVAALALGAAAAVLLEL